MLTPAFRSAVLLSGLVALSGCSSASGGGGEPARPPQGVAEAGADAGMKDGGGRAGDGGAMKGGGDGGAGGDAAATADAGVPCDVGGVPGVCILVSACASMGSTSTPGYCPGPADIECCTATPSVADNPPTPAGYMLMPQSEVTPAMTAWAVMILDDPATYPMFSTTTKVFGTQTVLARVEWHPPDFQNSAVHRGVTLYVPIA